MSFRSRQTSRRVLPPDFGGFTPKAIGGNSLKLWLRGDLGVTLGATLRATGTAPPAVTISGTLVPAVGLHIEIDSTAGGTGLGQATFKWSIDNGTSYVQTGVLTAASVALGSTGITAAFSAGPYNVDNKYDCTVSGWADQSGNGNDATEASAAFQWQYSVKAINGRGALNCDGGARRLRPPNIALTADSVFMIVKLNSAGSFIPFAHTTGADNRWIYTGINDSLRTQVGGVTSSKNASAGAGWLSTATQSVGRTYNGTHATNFLWNNMNAVTTTDVVVNDPGTASSNGQFTIGNNAGLSLGVNGFIAEMVCYSQALTSGEMTRLQNYFKYIWGF